MPTWTGHLVVIPQPDGSCLIGLALPPGVHREGTFQVFKGTGPVPPTGFPKLEHIEDYDAWLKQKQSEGFVFAAGSSTEHGSQIVVQNACSKEDAKSEDVASTWQVVIPMVQLRISNDPPIGGCWQVGDVCLMSKQAAKDRLKPPHVFADLTPEHAKHVFGDAQAFAVMQSTGTPKDLQKTVFREVREARDILAATDAFYGSRHHNSGFNLQGYPIITLVVLGSLTKRPTTSLGSPAEKDHYTRGA
jgi:hypothetical protein